MLISIFDKKSNELKVIQSVYWTFLIVFLPFCASTQALLQTQGQKIVNQNGEEILLKGMGLGGWMVQEGYMLQTAEFANPQHQIRARITDLIGEERAEQFYDAWLENHVTETDIIALKDWGFNSVRLPMHYNLFTLPIQAEPIEGENTWLSKGFELTDRVLQWCKEQEMYLILDLHAAPGGQGYDQGISDYNPNLPSLWESQLNQDKTVALWQRIAERYKDEEWVAGYDLINEPNWDLNQNQELRTLYERITEVIRALGDQHILFIEGNWFANDFTGLTPPWDNNMVYSPHKYWSFNDQNSIQWVLDLRTRYDVPLYLGETGENSNVWFKEAIELFANNNIGWAWWPMKKVESVAGPLSVEKTEGYESLLNFWKGNGPQIDADEAYNILMDLSEKLKFDNCKLQKDVIDAMFRQPISDATLPFSENEIPGIIYASDYDLGSIENAYFDQEYATYHVSTGEYTAWNNGWAYRNDGVDIELCEDDINSNGYNVGWCETNDWLKYTSNVNTAGVYDIHIRVASDNPNGQISFDINNAEATAPYPVPNTGDYQNWETLVVPDVILGSGEQSFKAKIINGGFNLSSFDFRYKTTSNSVIFDLNRAITLDPNTIQIELNKPLDNSNLFLESEFSLHIDGVDRTPSSISTSSNSDRILLLKTDAALRADQEIRVSYTGSNIKAFDQSNLFNFQRERVINTLSPVIAIPGIVEAEDFTLAVGIELEDCSDLGGGQNISFLDPGDYLEYDVLITQTADYFVRYRAASLNTSGKIRLTLIQADGTSTIIDEPSFTVTGGWQNWQSYENEIALEAGAYRLRIDILNAPFNLNWIEFESQLIEEPKELGIKVFPNPTQNQLILEANFNVPHQIDYIINDVNGRLIDFGIYNYSTEFFEPINLSALSAGIYFLNLELETGERYNFRVIKK